MKSMIFCDLENFRHSIKEKYEKYQKIDVNFEKFHHFLLRKITENLKYEVHNPRIIRSYVYTGEYTDAQINKAIIHHRDLPQNQARLKSIISQRQEELKTCSLPDRKISLESEISRLKRKVLSPERIENLKIEIGRAKRCQIAQKALFNDLSRIHFLELRTKPLKYSPKDLRFIQKGTDVQLGVDLVNFAHFNNYDIAILCSGDLDLLESCRLIKELGKTLVIVSHEKQVSPKMVQMSDYYLNIKDLTEPELSEISIVENYGNNAEDY